MEEIKLTNSNAMATLLEAIGLRKYEYIPKQDCIILNISKLELAYAINSASESIQYIYCESDEWKELISYL